MFMMRISVPCLCAFGGGFRELVEDHVKAEGDKMWQWNNMLSIYFFAIDLLLVVMAEQIIEKY
jgi:hypothetical protein